MKRHRSQGRKLLLGRDLHENVQAAKVETDKMLIQMVEAELEKRATAVTYKEEIPQGLHHIKKKFYPYLLCRRTAIGSQRPRFIIAEIIQHEVNAYNGVSDSSAWMTSFRVRFDHLIKIASINEQNAGNCYSSPRILLVVRSTFASAIKHNRSYSGRDRSVANKIYRDATSHVTAVS